MSEVTARLEAFPEDWERGLAVVAHPDDMEYGAAAAVARWTGRASGSATCSCPTARRGSRRSPAEAGPLRRDEQRASCAVVGVTDVEFLGLPDGSIVEGLELRADLAAAIRRHRPDVVLSINFRDSWGGPSWNHADHRAVGRALLDAVATPPTPGVPGRGPLGRRPLRRFNASPQPTHAVDTTATFEPASGRSSATASTSRTSAATWPRPPTSSAARPRPRGPVGVDLAATFEIIG